MPARLLILGNSSRSARAVLHGGGADGVRCQPVAMATGALEAVELEAEAPEYPDERGEILLDAARSIGRGEGARRSS